MNMLWAYQFSPISLSDPEVSEPTQLTKLRRSR